MTSSEQPACTCRVTAEGRTLDRSCPVHGDEAEARRLARSSQLSPTDANDAAKRRRLRVARAEIQLRAAALTWHHLVDGPDRFRGRRAVEDLHAACAELASALEEAER